MKILFVIFSCKKYLRDAELLYSILNNNINAKILITYGENIDKNYKVIDDKYLILNVKDDYEYLNEKSIALFNSVIELYPDIKGIFKCDDDIIPNINHINNYINNLSKNNVDYGGKCLNVERRVSPEKGLLKEYLLKKKIDEKFFKCAYKPVCKFCPGPIYYLSNRAIKMFQLKDIEKIFFEDVMVGNHLTKNKIYPDDKPLYSDNFSDFHISIHNCEKLKKIFLELDGNFDNQLFDVMSSIILTRKYNRILILVEKRKSYNKDIGILFPNFVKIGENNSYLNNIQKLDGSKIKNELINEDIILKNYKNEVFIKESPRRLLNIFKNDKKNTDLLKKYPDIEKSYFIYTDNSDDSFLNESLKTIKAKEKDAKFYFLTNKPNSKYDTLILKDTEIFFLIPFFKGGICSGRLMCKLATYLNDDENKLILFPKI